MIYGGENEQQSDHLLAQLSQVVIYLSTHRINLSLGIFRNLSSWVLKAKKLIRHNNGIESDV